jgi:sugar phosphate permease
MIQFGSERNRNGQGIGASLSGLDAGMVVDGIGYRVAFLAADGAACVAMAVFALRMPETAEMEDASCGIGA